MMQNNNGDGIVCDYCGDSCDIDFTYYSFDISQIGVYDYQHSIKKDLLLSADVCEKCMEAYRNRIKETYKPSTRKDFYCDISGVHINSGEFTYYKCVISRITVALSGQLYQCEKCGGTLKDENDICDRCKTGSAVRRADVNIDGEYLVINMCSEIYDKFTKHISMIKNLTNDILRSPNG